MLGLLPQPKMQAAEATIITLCDRLAHSTMLEDRRAAMLSLKGFAHDKRELVASNGLKALINSLKQDKNDPETIRACVETLVILFVKASSVDSDLAELSRRARQKNKRYVSPLIASRKVQNDIVKGPVDDISLWLTDEFTHDDENVVALLELAQSQDMFTSLYSLQLLSAMVTNRPDTIKQSLFSVHCGISTLVSALGSRSEMVRDETVLLLLNLTDNHLEFQKLVAFEGAFDKLFTIIDDEGGICFGGVTVENCLSLFSNLLQYNVSNQKLFSASQGITKYGQMLETPDDTNWGDQATTNMTAALQLARLFVIPGGESTRAHQDQFSQAGVLLTVLKLAFGPVTSLPIRIASLLTAASLIYENQPRQEELLGIDVPYYDLSLSLNIQMQPQIVPVSQALLNWSLLLPSNYLFTLRAASQFCLNAAFEGNESASIRFIDEQTTALKHLETSTPPMANIFHTLAEYNEDTSLNPFKIWFAAVMLIHLIQSSDSVKDHVRKVKIGDAELGQDELPIIQAISGQLLSSFDNEDPTVSLAYLMLLSVWLFDDMEAVNDFVSERSQVQQLITYVTTNNGGTGDVLVCSLATILLGIAYDFCSTDSPLPRADFYHLLTNTLGRDQYTLSLRRFRENTEFKDFDPSVIFAAPKGSNGLPRVYFDSKYIDLVRENINRIQRAIDRDPTVEPSSRVSLEMYEELKLSMLSREKEVKELEQLVVQKEEQFASKENDLKSEVLNLTASLENLQGVHDTLTIKVKALEERQEPLESELSKLKSDHENLSTAHKEKLELLTINTKKLEESETKISRAEQKISQLSTAKEKAEDGVNKLTRELLQLTKNGSESQKGFKNLQSQVTELTQKLEAANKQEAVLKSKIKESEEHLRAEKETSAKLQGTNEKLVNKLKETAELLDEGEKTEAHLNDAIRELESARAELEACRYRVANLEKENKLIRAKLESARGASSQGSSAGKLDPVVALLEEKVQSLEAQLALAQAELDTESMVDEELEEVSKVRDQLATDLEVARNRIATLEQELASSKAPVEEKDEFELLGLRSQVSELEARLEEQLHGADPTHNGLASELENVKSKLEETESALSTLQVQHDEVLKSLRSAEERAEELAGISASHDTKIEGAQNGVSDNSAGALKPAIEELQKTQNDLSEAKLELEALRSAISEVKQDIEKFKDNSQVNPVDGPRVESKSNEKEELSALLANAQAEILQYKAQLELARTELECSQDPSEENTEMRDALENLKKEFNSFKLQAETRAAENAKDIEALLLLLEDATNRKNSLKFELQELGHMVEDSGSDYDEDSFLL